VIRGFCFLYHEQQQWTRIILPESYTFLLNVRLHQRFRKKLNCKLWERCSWTAYSWASESTPNNAAHVLEVYPVDALTGIQIGALNWGVSRYTFLILLSLVAQDVSTKEISEIKRWRVGCAVPQQRHFGLTHSICDHRALCCCCSHVKRRARCIVLMALNDLTQCFFHFYTRPSMDAIHSRYSGFLWVELLKISFFKMYGFCSLPELAEPWDDPTANLIS